MRDTRFPDLVCYKQNDFEIQNSLNRTPVIWASKSDWPRTRYFFRVRGKEDPYLKIGEVNDRTKPASSKKSLTTIEHGGRCEIEQPEVGPKGAALGQAQVNKFQF